MEDARHSPDETRASGSMCHATPAHPVAATDSPAAITTAVSTVRARAASPATATATAAIAMIGSPAHTAAPSQSPPPTPAARAAVHSASATSSPTATTTGRGDRAPTRQRHHRREADQPEHDHRLVGRERALRHGGVDEGDADDQRTHTMSRSSPHSRVLLRPFGGHGAEYWPSPRDL